MITYITTIIAINIVMLLLSFKPATSTQDVANNITILTIAIGNVIALAFGITLFNS